MNPSLSDAPRRALSKLMVPVIALGGVAFVFAGGQTIVTLLLLGYALVTQLFPSLVMALVAARVGDQVGRDGGHRGRRGDGRGDVVRRRDARTVDRRSTRWSAGCRRSSRS